MLPKAFERLYVHLARGKDACGARRLRAGLGLPRNTVPDTLPTAPGRFVPDELLVSSRH